MRAFPLEAFVYFRIIHAFVTPCTAVVPFMRCQPLAKLISFYQILATLASPLPFLRAFVFACWLVACSVRVACFPIAIVVIACLRQVLATHAASFGWPS